MLSFHFPWKLDASGCFRPTDPDGGQGQTLRGRKEYRERREEKDSVSSCMCTHKNAILYFKKNTQIKQKRTVFHEVVWCHTPKGLFYHEIYFYFIINGNSILCLFAYHLYSHLSCYISCKNKTSWQPSQSYSGHLYLHISSNNFEKVSTTGTWRQSLDLLCNMYCITIYYTIHIEQQIYILKDVEIDNRLKVIQKRFLFGCIVWIYCCINQL